MKISLVILAAGTSSRFPTNKLLYKIEGKTVLQHTLEKGVLLPFYKRVIVTQYEEIQSYASLYKYELIKNTHPEKGISYSMKLGLQACIDSDYIMFLVGDQPFLKVETLEKMIRYCDHKHIICASYHNAYRNPVVFPAYVYEELLTLYGDKGGSQLLGKYQEQVILVACEKEEVQDIDTLEDVKLFGFKEKT